MALTTTSGTGSQTTTDSPQTSAGASANAATGSSVQPGTATSVLTSHNGLPLHPNSLSTVSLNGAGQTQTHAQTQQAASTTPHHHPNYVLLGISAALLIVAIVLFWLTSRPVKSTTK